MGIKNVVIFMLYLKHVYDVAASSTEELRPVLLVLSLHNPEKRTLRNDNGKKLLEDQQRRKRKEIMSFLEKNYMSTNYFYDEMKRILATRTLKDPLRLMVEYLEKPDNSLIRTKLLQCYASLRVQKHKVPDIFSYTPNNLVINVIKDPYNDGVV